MEGESDPKPALCELDELAIDWLRDYLRPGQLTILAKALQELHEVRFGDFRMVIADGCVQSFKITKSYQ